MMWTVDASVDFWPAAICWEVAKTTDVAGSKMSAHCALDMYSDFSCNFTVDKCKWSKEDN